jgi:hypothetical protein
MDLDAGHCDKPCPYLIRDQRPNMNDGAGDIHG